MKPNTILKTVLFLVIVFAAHSVFAHGMSEAEKQAIIGGGYLQYMWLGASHMLTGYEHTMNPDEFGFPDDNHFHAHETMDANTPATPLPGSEYLAGLD